MVLVFRQGDKINTKAKISGLDIIYAICIIGSTASIIELPYPLAQQLMFRPFFMMLFFVNALCQAPILIITSPFCLTPYPDPLQDKFWSFASEQWAQGGKTVGVGDLKRQAFKAADAYKAVLDNRSK